MEAAVAKLLSVLRGRNQGACAVEKMLLKTAAAAAEGVMGSGGGPAGGPSKGALCEMAAKNSSVRNPGSITLVAKGKGGKRSLPFPPPPPPRRSSHFLT